MSLSSCENNSLIQRFKITNDNNNDNNDDNYDKIDNKDNDKR